MNTFGYFSDDLKKSVRKTSQKYKTYLSRSLSSNTPLRRPNSNLARSESKPHSRSLRNSAFFERPSLERSHRTQSYRHSAACYGDILDGRDSRYSQFYSSKQAPESSDNHSPRAPTFYGSRISSPRRSTFLNEEGRHEEMYDDQPLPDAHQNEQVHCTSRNRNSMSFITRLRKLSPNQSNLQPILRRTLSADCSSDNIKKHSRGSSLGSIPIHSQNPQQIKNFEGSVIPESLDEICIVPQKIPYYHASNSKMQYDYAPSSPTSIKRKYGISARREDGVFSNTRVNSRPLSENMKSYFSSFIGISEHESDPEKDEEDEKEDFSNETRKVERRNKTASWFIDRFSSFNLMNFLSDEDSHGSDTGSTTSREKSLTQISKGGTLEPQNTKRSQDKSNFQNGARRRLFPEDGNRSIHSCHSVYSQLQEDRSSSENLETNRRSNLIPSSSQRLQKNSINRYSLQLSDLNAKRSAHNVFRGESVAERNHFSSFQQSHVRKMPPIKETSKDVTHSQNPFTKISQSAIELNKKLVRFGDALIESVKSIDTTSQQSRSLFYANLNDEDSSSKPSPKEYAHIYCNRTPVPYSQERIPSTTSNQGALSPLSILEVKINKNKVHDENEIKVKCRESQSDLSSDADQIHHNDLEQNESIASEANSSHVEKDALSTNEIGIFQQTINKINESKTFIVSRLQAQYNKISQEENDLHCKENKERTRETATFFVKLDSIRDKVSTFSKRISFIKTDIGTDLQLLPEKEELIEEKQKEDILVEEAPHSEDIIDDDESLEGHESQFCISNEDTQLFDEIFKVCELDREQKGSVKGSAVPESGEYTTNYQNNGASAGNSPAIRSTCSQLRFSGNGSYIEKDNGLSHCASNSPYGDETAYTNEIMRGSKYCDVSGVGPVKKIAAMNECNFDVKSEGSRLTETSQRFQKLKMGAQKYFIARNFSVKNKYGSSLSSTNHSDKQSVRLQFDDITDDEKNVNSVRVRCDKSDCSRPSTTACGKDNDAFDCGEVLGDEDGETSEENIILGTGASKKIGARGVVEVAASGRQREGSVALTTRSSDNIDKGKYSGEVLRRVREIDSFHVGRKVDDGFQCQVYSKKVNLKKSESDSFFLGNFNSTNSKLNNGDAKDVKFTIGSTASIRIEEQDSEIELPSFFKRNVDSRQPLRHKAKKVHSSENLKLSKSEAKITGVESRNETPVLGSGSSVTDDFYDNIKLDGTAASALKCKDKKSDSFRENNLKSNCENISINPQNVIEFKSAVDGKSWWKNIISAKAKIKRVPKCPRDVSPISERTQKSEEAQGSPVSSELNAGTVLINNSKPSSKTKTRINNKTNSTARSAISNEHQSQEKQFAKSTVKFSSSCKTEKNTHTSINEESSSKCEGTKDNSSPRTKLEAANEVETQRFFGSSESKKRNEKLQNSENFESNELIESAFGCSQLPLEYGSKSSTLGPPSSKSGLAFFEGYEDKMAEKDDDLDGKGNKLSDLKRSISSWSLSTFKKPKVTAPKFAKVGLFHGRKKKG